MRCRSLLVALSLLAVASSSTAVASALEGSAPGHPTAGLDIATLDARIEKAQAHIDRWYPRIERWYRHIRRAAARVDRLEELAPASSIVADGAGSLGRSHRQDPAFRLAEANRELRDTLRSSRARRAQRQLDAWSAVLAELVSAREGALRPPPAVRDPAPRALRGRPVTYEGWAAAFLGRLGAPACGENLLIVVAWTTAESTSAAFNPLATTRDMPGDSDFNTVGVKSYASLGQGLDASRDTLLLGAESYGYAAIVDSLQGCRSAKVTARAINASAWCRGCVGGAYVTGLLPIVRATYDEHAARLVSSGP
jgi:hypothetical protein